MQIVKLMVVKTSKIKCSGILLLDMLAWFTIDKRPQRQTKNRQKERRKAHYSFWHESLSLPSNLSTLWFQAWILPRLCSREADLYSAHNFKVHPPPPSFSLLPTPFLCVVFLLFPMFNQYHCPFSHSARYLSAPLPFPAPSLLIFSHPPTLWVSPSSPETSKVCLPPTSAPRCTTGGLYARAWYPLGIIQLGVEIHHTSSGKVWKQ